MLIINILQNWGGNRSSSFELLRVISIVLIIAVHAGYYTFGTPTPNEIRVAPLSNFFYIFTENISVICVDIFIMISGWFGIHPKVKSIGGLFFQCIFFNILLLLAYTLFAPNIASFSITSFVRCFISFPHFVKGYAVLYFFAPVLNTFIEKSSEKQFRTFLLCFFVWMFIFGWFLHNDDNMTGNSTLSFIGLYMLARYLRLHSSFTHRYTNWQPYFLIWLANILIITTIVELSAIVNLSDRLSNILINLTTSYASPNVVLASATLLICFSKMRFKNAFINLMGASAFAAVLLHGKYMDVVFCELLRCLHLNYSLPLFLAFLLILFSAILLLSIVIDQLRIKIWTKLYQSIQTIIVSHLSKYNDRF